NCCRGQAHSSPPQLLQSFRPGLSDKSLHLGNDGRHDTVHSIVRWIRNQPESATHFPIDEVGFCAPFGVWSLSSYWKMVEIPVIGSTPFRRVVPFLSGSSQQR